MPTLKRSGRRDDRNRDHHWRNIIFAYIPARGGSRRIPRKNIRLLGDVPIIGHVIKTLRDLNFIDRVHVSTDDDEIKAIAESFGAECLAPRAKSLASDAPGFIDLIHDDLPRYASANGGDEEVLFVLATAALVPDDVFTDAYGRYVADEPEVLMSCEGFHMSPFWAMTQKADGFWRPICPEKVMVPSSELPVALIDAGLFYFFRLSTMARYRSLKLVDRLQAYVIPEDLACDVDTESDWQRLEGKYMRAATRA